MNLIQTLIACICVNKAMNKKEDLKPVYPYRQLYVQSGLLSDNTSQLQRNKEFEAEKIKAIQQVAQDL